jgi:UDPglucose--hexose-1-phosphate uridylyltransferase
MDADTRFTVPHRRKNLLTDEWLVVSPHRIHRPWQGQLEEVPAEQHPCYDSSCYLCPGNTRALGLQNPSYAETFVFDNDYAALLPNIEPQALARRLDHGSPLLQAESERGICRVVCYSPRHDLTLADMEIGAVRCVVDAWAEQYTELAALPWVNHVQIFENRGAMMGASNPHPHGQIWGSERVPNEPAKELEQQRSYRAKHGTCLLCDYLTLELQIGERLVCENEHFVALVPFWAIWPFETLVLPRAHHGALADLDAQARDGLADILRRLTRRYNRLFAVAFPYSMGFHQRPTDGAEHLEWHMHAHFYPPLLRSATVRKFMVGYELLGEPLRDITPESAAERLRGLTER